MTPTETVLNPDESKKRGRPPGIAGKRQPKVLPTIDSIARGAFPEARRRGVAVLSVLSGDLTTKQAATSLGITLPRYYALEVEAFGGLVRSLEPKPKGYQRSPERRAEVFSKENARLNREVERLKSLLRTTQRTVGMLSAVSDVGATGDGKRRARKPTTRATRLAQRLKEAVPAEGMSGADSEHRPSAAGKEAVHA